MADDFYPFVDSGDRAPDNSHITGTSDGRDAGEPEKDGAPAPKAAFATRIAIYDDMFSTPRVVVIEPNEVRPYLEEVTNTVYRCMKEQGGDVSLMVIREIVENFIHAHFVEPIISILDGGNTIRFADQGPGIADKERAFEFGVTSADRDMKRYIRGTGAGFPMVQQYLEAAGGAVSIEDNLGAGTVVTVSLDPTRVTEIRSTAARGAAVRFSHAAESSTQAGPATPAQSNVPGAAAGTMPGQGGDAPHAPAGGAGQEGLGGNPAYPTSPYGSAPMPGGAPAPMPDEAGWPQQPVGQQAQQAPYQIPPYQQNPYQQGWQQPWGQQMWAPQPAQPYPTSPLPSGGWTQQGGWYPYGYQPTAPTPMPQPAGGGQQESAQGGLYVSDRGRLALAYLLEHGQAGPTDLAGAYGQSGPTWSRELATLSEGGFVMKRGQKYHLTELGSSWMRTQ